MKNTIKVNPINILRISHGFTNEGFAKHLHFPNISQYLYHSRNFSMLVIERIKDAFNVDLNSSIIAYQKYYMKTKKREKSTQATKPVKKNKKTSAHQSAEVINSDNCQLDLMSTLEEVSQDAVTFDNTKNDNSVNVNSEPKLEEIHDDTN